MATHDDPHGAIADAELLSLDGKHRLVMRLIPLVDPKHRDWMGYELHMRQEETGERVSLVAREDRELFLDRVIEPEIPELCNGIRAVILGEERYTFTPIDEKDFRLEVRKQANSFIVCLQYRAEPASDQFGWPNGIPVSAAALASFADSLERSFVALHTGNK